MEVSKALVVGQFHFEVKVLYDIVGNEELEINREKYLKQPRSFPFEESLFLWLRLVDGWPVIVNVMKRYLYHHLYLFHQG